MRRYDDIDREMMERYHLSPRGVSPRRSPERSAFAARYLRSPSPYREQNPHYDYQDRLRSPSPQRSSIPSRTFNTGWNDEPVTPEPGPSTTGRSLMPSRTRRVMDF